MILFAKNISIVLSVLFLVGLILIGSMAYALPGQSAGAKPPVNICAYAYKHAQSQATSQSNVSCADAWSTAASIATFTCSGALASTSCPFAGFCSPTGQGYPEGYLYGPCAITVNPGEPSIYTATTYAFCGQKCG